MIFLAVAALADSTAAWKSLQEARLIEAADGTPEAAAQMYEELVAELQPTDPEYGPAWYWLGRTRWGLGEADAAVAALSNALQDPAVAAQAAAFLMKIELKRRAVRTLPATFTFDDARVAFVRNWEGADRGSLGIRTAASHSVLSWATTVRAGEADHIAMALDTGARIKSIAFQVRAQAFPAELRVTVSDGAGARYSAPVIQVPTGQWMDVSLPAASFRSTDGARGGGGSALQPTDPVRLVEVEDLTGLLSPDRGVNTIYLDSVEIH